MLKLIAAVALIGLSACAATLPKAGAPANTIDIGGGASLTLPTRPGFDGTRHLSQLITATHDGTPIRVQSELDIGPDAVIAVLSPLGGPPMMTINWSAAGIIVDKDAALPDALDGRRILADIVLAEWPRAFIEAHLSEGARFSENDTRRRVAVDAADVIEIVRSRAGARETVTITNLAQNYELTILSKRAKP